MSPMFAGRNNISHSGSSVFEDSPVPKEPPTHTAGPDDPAKNPMTNSFMNTGDSISGPHNAKKDDGMQIYGLKKLEFTHLNGEEVLTKVSMRITKALAHATRCT